MRYKYLLFLISALIFVNQNTQAQGILRQEAYRFEASNIVKGASLGVTIGDFVEDTMKQIWAVNGAHLLKVSKNQTEIFATAGRGVLNGYIIRLITDSKKHVWISTNKGLYHLDPISQNLTPHLIKIDNQILRTQALSGLGNYIFAATGKGEIVRYHPATRRASLLLTGFETSFVPFLNSTSSGKVYFANRTHLFQIVDSNQIIRICKLPDGYMPVGAESTDENNLYLSTINGPLLKVNLHTKEVKILTLVNNEITRGIHLKKVEWYGKTYIVQATVQGIVWLNPVNDEQLYWHNNPLQKGGKFIGAVEDVQQDRYGRLWIGTGDDVLTLMPVQKNTTPYFLHDKSDASWNPGSEEGPTAIVNDSKTKKIIYSIADTAIYFDKPTKQIIAKIPLGLNKKINELLLTPQGDILAGTTDGLYKISNGKPSVVSDSLHGKNVIRMLLKGDTIFAGTYSHGLYGMLQNGQFLEHHGKATGMTGNHFPALCLDKEDRVWMINGRSALYVRNGNKTFLEKYDYNAIGAAFIYDIQCDLDSNKIWLGGEGGILSYHAKTGATNDITTSVPNGFEFGIYRLHQKDDGRMFVSTAGNKLFEWDLQTRKVLPINFERGWWAENLLNRSNITRDENGEWWGTFRYGIMQFNVKTFFSATSLNPPQIKALEIKYLPWNYHPSFYTENPLQLNFSESPLTLVCSSIYNDKVQFKLEGLENKWQTGERATYTNLREGKYTFKVRTVDEVGNYSNEVMMMVKVLPPWWRTWWFRILAAIIVSAGLYFFIRKTIENIQKENEYKIKLANSELTAIRSQMNPHFIFNCMTAIDGLIATGQNLKASEYLGKFSKLVRQVLQLSEKQLISLGDELDTLKLYLQLEQLRTQDFTYEIKVEESLLEQIEIPPLLLQPIVENAILHGLKTATHHPKKITISANKIENKIQFEIEDNGIGRQQSTLNNLQRNNHKSMGGKLTKDRLQIMEQLLDIETNIMYKDLKDDLENATGTKVILTLTSKS